MRGKVETNSKATIWTVQQTTGSAQLSTAEDRQSYMMSHSPTHGHELYRRIPADAGKQQLELLVELLKSRTPGLRLVMQTTQKVLEIHIFILKKK